VKRSGWAMIKPCGTENFQPQLPAQQCHLVHLAGWLPNRPDHPEITDRGSAGSQAPFKDIDLVPTPRRDVGMGKAENPRTYDGDLHGKSLKLMSRPGAEKATGSTLALRQMLSEGRLE
jgi:hypothetical protein